MRWRRVAAALAVALVGVAIAATVIAIHAANEFLAASNDPGPLPEGGMPVSFRAEDGTRLAGWLVPGRTRPAPVVILAHGFPSSKAAMVDRVDAFHDAGLAVMGFDFRGQGTSGGSGPTGGDAEVKDLRAAVRFVSTLPEADPTRIGVVGVSMGAAVAIDETAADKRVRVVVAESSFPDLRTLISRRVDGGSVGAWLTETAMRLVKGIDVDAVDPVAHVGAIAPRPLLLVQDSDDDRITPADFQRLVHGAGRGASVWVVPDAPHRGAWEFDPGGYTRRVVSFVAAALAR